LQVIHASRIADDDMKDSGGPIGLRRMTIATRTTLVKF
jgi:hypothetical protein